MMQRAEIRKIPILLKPELKPSIRILKEFSRNHGLIPNCSGRVDNHRLYLTKEHDDICLDLSDVTYRLIDGESIHEIP